MSLYDRTGGKSFWKWFFSSTENMVVEIFFHLLFGYATIRELLDPEGIVVYPIIGYTVMQIIYLGMSYFTYLRDKNGNSL